MSITQTLTSAPAQPDRTDKVNFSGQVANYLSWESTSRGELITWTTQANALAVQVNADAVTTATSATMLDNAIAAVGAPLWVTGTTYAIGNVRLDVLNTYKPYLRLTNGDGSTHPSADAANWQLLNGSPSFKTIGGVSLLGSTDISFKTIGGVSLLGSTDIQKSLTVVSTTGAWVATSTCVEVTVIGGGGGAYFTSGTATAGGATSFIGQTVTITAPGGGAATTTSDGYSGNIGTNGDLNGRGSEGTSPNYDEGVSLLGRGGYGQGGRGARQGAGGSYAIKLYTNLVIGTSYTCTIGANGNGSDGSGRDGIKGCIIIKT